MSSEIKQALKSLQGFSALEETVLDQLIPFISTRVLRAGETIFCQGEPSPFCFGVLSGEVLIQHVSKDAHVAPKVLGTIGPGGLFGEAALFEDSPRAAMASAISDGKLILIRGPQFRQWLQKNAETGQPLLFALLQSSLKRLYRTSQELAVVYGIGRLLGSDKPLAEQLDAAFIFLKGSLEGLDDVVFYQRSAYWEEFSPVMSLPALDDLTAIPLEHEMVQTVSTAAAPHAFEPRAVRSLLLGLKLPWENRASIAVIPLFDWDKARDPLQGLLFLASAQESAAFSPEKKLLLTSLSRPLAEALSRQARQEEAMAQARLEQSKRTIK